MKKLLVVAALASSLLAPQAADAKRYNLTMTFGQDILLASNGSVTVRARCILNDFGIDRLQVYATTTSNAVMRAANSYAGNGSYLTAVTAPSASLLTQVGVATGTEFVAGSIDSGYVVNIESAQGFVVRTESSPLGVNTGGDDCLLSIDLVAIKKFKVPK